MRIRSCNIEINEATNKNFPRNENFQQHLLFSPQRVVIVPKVVTGAVQANFWQNTTSLLK